MGGIVMNENEIVPTEEQKVELNINQNMLILIDRYNELIFSTLLTNDEKIKYLQQLFDGLGDNQNNELKIAISKK